MRPVRVWVLGPCHIREDGETPCDTNDVRCDCVRELWREGDLVYVTGHVSRRPGGPTLDSITVTELRKRGIKPPIPIITGEANGIFPEAEEVTEKLAALRLLGYEPSFTWVCAKTYNWAARPVWEQEATLHRLPITFKGVVGLEGWRTWLLYTVYGVAIRIAMTTKPTYRLLRRIMYWYYERRAQHFTMNGCA